MNNQLVIDIPKGMQIDTTYSDLSKGIIKFKPINIDYKYIYNQLYRNNNNPKDLIEAQKTKAKYFLKLLDIAKYYNGDWKPNWNTLDAKYYIALNKEYNIIRIQETFGTDLGFIYFKNKEDAQAVTENPNFKSILQCYFDL